MSDSSQSELSGSVRNAPAILGVMWPRPGIQSLANARFFVFNKVFEHFRSVAPLLAPLRQEESVNFSMKGAVVAPVLLAIGISMSRWARGASRVLGRREKPSALGWVIYLVTFGLGVLLLLYQWFKSRLRAYGYGV